MADERVRGASLLGDEPKRLELSDGSRLILDGSAERDRIEWRRLGRGWTNVSVSEAVSLAGDEFADYVTVRTRGGAAGGGDALDRGAEEAEQPRPGAGPGAPAWRASPAAAATRCTPPSPWRRWPG